MIHEICYGLIGNFIFSLGLFTYKRYNHSHYDEIIYKLNIIEQMMIQNCQPYNIKYFTKDEYYK